jgi:hypothetical protein
MKTKNFTKVLIALMFVSATPFVNGFVVNPSIGCSIEYPESCQ